MKKIEIEELKYSAVDVFDTFKTFPGVFFLDSSMNGGKLGRYSFIGIEPFLNFTSKGKEITIVQDGKTYKTHNNPFDALNSLMEEYKIKSDTYDFPFIGGAVGYFSYDLCQILEKLPKIAIDDLKIPDCQLNFYDTIFIFDNILKKSYICSNIFLNKAKRKKYYLNLLSANSKKNVKSQDSANIKLSHSKFYIESNFTKEKYYKAILKAKEYISAGDIYQVNLSQRFQASLNIDAFDLYSILRQKNPAPFSAYLDFENVKIVSSSPERFLKIRGSYVETCPIKGTRPRMNDTNKDKKMGKELLNSVKDKAEHIMIVDLERNDLGRVCEYGSVKVSEMFALEKYATVFHLVSTVTGVLHKAKSPIDCLRACFPGGSITGAPKIRSMEIIEELEPTKRNIYTGSMGYLSFNGNIDLNIAIRTFVIKNNIAYFSVGGGIVADSDPYDEYKETLDKAKALIESVKLSHSDKKLAMG
ncbi:MAG: aminodeoxychorismate synthase component I [Candidatus Firestonebacteria bacterium]